MTGSRGRVDGAPAALAHPRSASDRNDRSIGRPAGFPRPVLRFHSVPRSFFSVLLAAFIVVALIHGGPHAFAQTTLNGLTSGAYFALGAVGLTFIYGSLRLINFAHGDFLTFGAYMGFLANVTLHLPLAVAALFAVATTAALGVTTEKVMWRPMRSRCAGTFQVILMAVGLAFVLRYGIQFVVYCNFGRCMSTRRRRSSCRGVSPSVAPRSSSPSRSYLVLAGVGAMLRFSNLGKQMRALSDDLALAETTGIDTQRVILVIWIFAACLPVSQASSTRAQSARSTPTSASSTSGRSSHPSSWAASAVPTGPSPAA